MDFTIFILALLSCMPTDTKASVKCHDCSSWNPYCRHQVDEPFESAVAVVECEKTSTCFLKKDESGVINRGCADWWQESQVDTSYVGCRTQHVPWLGEMIWCFCNQDYCNGGSLDMMAMKVYPQVKDLPQDQGGGHKEWTESVADTVTDKATDEKNAENTVKSASKGDNQQSYVETRPARPSHTFDDLNPHYLEREGKKNSDPKYTLWFWHADSDRPKWDGDGSWDGHVEDAETWRAPQWVEEKDGEGWDFPVAGRIHTHAGGVASYDYDTKTNGADQAQHNHDDVEGEDQDKAGVKVKEGHGGWSEAAAEQRETWRWGEGWGHIKPWWLRGDEGGKATSTGKPVRWTPHPTPQGQQQNDGYKGTANKLQEEESWGHNDLQDAHHDVGKHDQVNEINIPEFFCWDCYSDSPLCGESVDTQKAPYLGKSACPLTHKCFVRNDSGVIYRGCADGWASSSIATDYLGCRHQQIWGRLVEWCFCAASLCNSDSLAQIKQKYYIYPEAYKATTMVSMKGSQPTSELAAVRSPFANTQLAGSDGITTRQNTAPSTASGGKTRVVVVVSRPTGHVSSQDTAAASAEVTASPGVVEMQGARDGESQHSEVSTGKWLSQNHDAYGEGSSTEKYKKTDTATEHLQSAPAQHTEHDDLHGSVGRLPKETSRTVTTTVLGTLAVTQAALLQSSSLQPSSTERHPLKPAVGQKSWSPFAPKDMESSVKGVNMPASSSQHQGISFTSGAEMSRRRSVRFQRGTERAASFFPERDTEASTKGTAHRTSGSQVGSLIRSSSSIIDSDAREIFDSNVQVNFRVGREPEGTSISDPAKTTSASNGLSGNWETVNSNWETVNSLTRTVASGQHTGDDGIVNGISGATGNTTAKNGIGTEMGAENNDYKALVSQ